MGVGKSCAIIGTAAWLYREKKIDTLIIVAPNGVHANWTLDEIPDHMPDAVKSEMMTLTWFSSKATQVGTQKKLQELIDHKGLAVIVMSYHAVMTPAGSKALKRVLEERGECLYVLDESGRIKEPNTKTTIRMLATSSYAKYRRILTGTPVDNSPFDVYTQIKFIRPDLWASKGIKNFSTFKARYGVWTMVRWDPSNRRKSPLLVRYRKLDELRAIVDEVGSRLLKKDVLDLPDKLYEKRYFDLDPEQAKAYKEIDKTFRAWLGQNGTATAELALTRMLRMTQLCSGFVKNDEDEVVPVGDNVRLRALRDTLEDVTGHVIIWCRWSWEVDQVRAMLGEKDAVYYDGRTSDDERIEAKRRFQKEGTARFFVAKASAAGEGLTLHRAKTVIYMTNTWSLRERLQSEDRAHRAGMSHEPVTYIDLVARNTYDEKTITALQRKKSTADIITGDKVTPWL
jgi:SNF2 family DNA or RNA helicase